MMVWKCYRCDLTFKHESHVVLHKDITKHSIRQIEITAYSTFQYLNYRFRVILNHFIHSFIDWNNHWGSFFHYHVFDSRHFISFYLRVFIWRFCKFFKGKPYLNFIKCYWKWLIYSCCAEGLGNYKVSLAWPVMYFRRFRLQFRTKIYHNSIELA